MKKNWKFRFILTAASALLLATAAFALDGTWINPGGGSWNTANPNWTGDVIAGGVGYTANFTADVPTTNTTVNLDGGLTIGNLVFSDTDTTSAGSWIIATGSGGPLTLNAGLLSPTITVNTLESGKFAQINAVLAGTNGFTKTGAGALLLNNASNSISGPVVLSQGNIQLNGAALTNATSVAINGGTLVVATSTNAIGGTISFNGGLLQHNNAPESTDYSAKFSTAANQNYRIAVTSGASVVTYSTDLSSAGGTLEKAGVGKLILAAANTFTGAAKVTAGNLALSNALALQNSALDTANSVTGTASAGIMLPGVTTPTFGGLTGNKALASLFDTDDGGYAGVTNLTLNPVSGANYSYSGVIANGAANMPLTKTGYGTQTLSVANSYSGGTILSAGTLNIGNATALGSGALTFTGNSTLQAGGAYTVANNISVNTSVTGTLDTNGNATTLSGALTGNGTLTKTGAGILTLTGGTNNTLSGAININADTLRSTDGTSFKNMTGAVTVTAGASFYFGQNFVSENNLANALTLSGGGTGGNGALNLAYNAVSIGPVTLAADATISHDWNNASINGDITGADGNLTLASTRTGQGPLTVNGNISLGNGTLIKTGPNSVTLNGSNGYGSAVIETGVLYFLQVSAMGGSGANITIQDNGVAARNGTDLENLLLRVNTASTGALAFGGSATTASNALNMSAHPLLSLGSRGTMAYSGTITPGGGNYRLGGGGGTLTVNSTLTGANGVIIYDAQGGTVVLTGARDYTGPTIIKTGTLRAHGTLNGAVSVMSGGTLAPGPAGGTGSLVLDQALAVEGTLSIRVDRSATQKADLLTVPSLALNGKLTVVNTGAALQAGDTFQLFSVSGSISQNNLTFDLPVLDVGLTWNLGSLTLDGILTVAVGGNKIGDPDFPEFLPSQLQALRDAGHTGATINPGTYNLPDGFQNQSTFTLNGWSNFTIDCGGALFTVGKQRAFQLNNCDNVTIRNLTVRARYPSFTQGRVLGKGNNPNGSVYAMWRISEGYPTQFQTDETYAPSGNEVRAGFAINAVNGTTGIINQAAGDTYGCILTPQGSNTWKVDFPNRTSMPFDVNDWLVTRLDASLRQGYAVFLNNSTNCTIESVTSQGGEFGTFYEYGGGGNRLIGCRIECSPVIPPVGSELPVVSCSSDGVHARDAYPGIRIDKLVTTGVLLDDCIAIHGVFREVTAVSGNTITVSSLGKLAVDDPVRISHDEGYFAQAMCTGILDVGGGSHQITLDQALPVPVGSRVCNPKYDGDGFQIINCELSGTRSRAIITKADNGLISGCTIQHSGTAIKIGPEYHWNESGYSWNVIVENTVITHCKLGIYVNADGAMGNRNLIVRNNTFGTMLASHAILLEGTDGATISGNNFGAPLAAETIRFEYSKDVTLANNLVAYSPTGVNLLRGTSNVTNLQGSTNGLLYSGRAYALTNSLSGLLLANPFSNAAGDPAQQYTECNASGRWFLQADGTGHTKIISAANGLVLGVNESSATGTPLVLEPSGAGDGQRWTLAPVGSSTIELINKFSGLSVTVQTTAAMETVSQGASAAGAGQLWLPTFNDYTYATWAATSGAGPDPSGDDNDNGVINLLEYALASDVATSESMITEELVSLDVESQADDFLTLAFQRRVAATDIVFNVECSTDLSTWRPNAVLDSSTPNPDGTTSEVWRSPTITGVPSGFMRVRVEMTD